MLGRKIVNLQPSQQRIDPFDTPVSELMFGNESVYGRLKRQLEANGYQIKKEGMPLLADFVCSDSFWKFASPSEVKGAAREVDATWNPPLVAEEKRLQRVNAAVDFQGSPEQDCLLTVPVGLPRALYGGLEYQVGFPSFFYQELSTWPELLTAGSLVAREYTSATFLQWMPLLGLGLLRWSTRRPSLARKFNKIGKGCRIHPTAILEGCVVGDDVEIGPYAYLRSSVIGDQVNIRDHSSVKLSVIGSGSFIMPCDLFNMVIGPECAVFTSFLHNCVLGAGVFVGGGSGFSDYNAGRTEIRLQSGGEEKPSGHFFLGSAVGERSFIGAGLIFRSGRAIPPDTQFHNGEMIAKCPSAPGKAFVAHAGEITQIPKEFLGGKG